MYADLKISVDKRKLVMTLQDNLARHDEIVKEATAAYCKEALKLLRAKIEELTKGKCSSLSFRLVPPVSHAEDYKRALAMLEMSKDAEVALDAETFQCFVEDDWEWMRSWLGSTSSFSSTASSCSSTKGFAGG